MSLRCPACGSAFRGTCHSRQCETARTRVIDKLPSAAPPKEDARRCDHLGSWFVDSCAECKAELKRRSENVRETLAPPSDAAPRTKDFHPDDRSTDPEDAPGGPWRSENIGDEDRSWGPTVWDSRVDAEGYGAIGVSRFYFETLPLAEAIRDDLNRDALNRLKGETDG